MGGYSFPFINYKFFVKDIDIKKDLSYNNNRRASCSKIRCFPTNKWEAVKSGVSLPINGKL